MGITASMVKELREKTGAGMMDCKKALVEVAGDLEKAVDWLRQKGMAKAAKKAGRATSEGLVAVAHAADGKSMAMAALLCETDFVARGEQFQNLAGQLAKSVLDNAPADAAARGILTNPLFSRLVRSKPVVKKSKCVGCGVCMRSCPGKAIELINKKPSFDYNKCIRCYCCQELCPQTAIEVWQPFFMKWLR